MGTSVVECAPSTRPPRARVDSVSFRDGGNIYSGGVFLAGFQAGCVKYASRIDEENPTRLNEPPLHICSGTSDVFVHKQKVSCAFYSSQNGALTIYYSGKLMEPRTSWWIVCMRTRVFTNTHTGPHPPLKNKSDVCVFLKGHVGETQHASSLVSFSQSKRYSGGRGQRHPGRQFTALLLEFHIIQVWEQRVGTA